MTVLTLISTWIRLHTLQKTGSHSFWNCCIPCVW